MTASAVTAGIGQTTIYALASIISAAIIGGVVYFFRHKDDSRDNQERIEAKVDTLVVALVGEPPTALNPSPQPGLIANVATYQRENMARKELGDELIIQFAEHKKIVNNLIATVDQIQKDVKELVADKNKDHGDSTRDAIDRMETKLGTSKPRKAVVKKAVPK